MGACCDAQAGAGTNPNSHNSLPNGWQIGHDANGRQYYQNTITKHTQWECPAELIPYIQGYVPPKPPSNPNQQTMAAAMTTTIQLNSPQNDDPNELPPQWIKKDAGNKTYYQNNETKTTQWENPIVPPEWKKYYNDDGRRYYKHLITKEITFDVPKKPLSSKNYGRNSHARKPSIRIKSDEKNEEDIEPQWERRVAGNKSYYQDRISKKTQWENPSVSPDWKKLYDNDGKRYYQNIKTKDVTYSAPISPGGNEIVDCVLPHGWEKRMDKNGKVYYQNAFSKHTQWKEPKERKDINEVLCVCGHKLVKEMDGSALYDGNGSTCDQCFTPSKKNDIVWHCTKAMNEPLHKFGFGVCQKCVVYDVYDQQRYTQKWKHLFSLGIDEDIVYNAWIHYKFDKEETLKFLMQYENMDNILCLCGCKLVKCKAKDIYDGPEAMCFICSAKGKNNEWYWHCLKQQREPIHKYGFDVCDKCVKTKKYDHPVFLEKFAKLFTLGVHEDDVWRAFIRNDQDPDEALKWLIEALQEHEQKNYEEQQKKLEEEFKKIMNRKPSIEYDIKEKDNKAAVTKKRENKVCHGDAKSCNSCQYLLDILNPYNKLLENNSDTTPFMEQFRSKMDAILRVFHHYLLWHKKDEDIDFMHQSLPYKCDLESCDTVQRYYRVRDENEMVNKQNRQNYAMNDMFHQLHCHFNHCYEIGHRLSAEEKAKLNKLAPQEQEYNEAEDPDAMQGDEDSMDGLIISKKMKELGTILNDKQTRLRKVRNITITESTNKFCTNFGQSNVTAIKQQNEQKESKTDHDEIKEDDEIEVSDNYVSYSYSFRFWYWKWFYFNNVKADTDNPEIGSRESFVPPKYQNFKQELLNNKISTLTLDEYEQLLEKAEGRMQCDMAKVLRSKHSENDLMQYYGIPNNQPIRLQHLLAIIVYTDMTVFQQKFSETFRLNKNESFKELVNRHSNYHFMARYLREAVEVYGIGKLDQDIKSFYHGVSREMKFDSFHGTIKGVLSTTSAINVATSFAGHKGIIVTMQPRFTLQFFECYWLSNFPHEAEYLFIGGRARMSFKDIVFCDTGDRYEKYITALRCINTFNDGYNFDTVTDRWMEWMHFMLKADKTGCPDTENLKPLRKKMKKLITFLIYYELNRYQPQKYGQFVKNKTLDGYIREVSHHMFICKKQIILDLESLEIAEMNSDDVIVGGGGHIGYKFLKDIFIKDCDTEKERINFEVIGLLYPRLIALDVVNFNKLSKIDIIELIEFVGNNDCMVRLNIGENGKDIYTALTTQIFQIATKLKQAKVETHRSESETEFEIVFLKTD